MIVTVGAPSKRRWRGFIAALGLWCGEISASDVYKCSVSGTLVFQDTPCADGKKLEVHGSVAGSPLLSGRDIHSLTLREMDARSQRAASNIRQLADEQRQRTAAVRAKYGIKDGRRLMAELDQIHMDYESRIDREMAVIKALDDESRKRCPIASVRPASCGQ